MDDDHRVPLPGLARHHVPNTTPEVHDLLAPVVHAAGAAELVTSNEVVGKRLPYCLKAGGNVSFDSV
jgi:hypothetical protein